MAEVGDSDKQVKEPQSKIPLERGISRRKFLKGSVAAMGLPFVGATIASIFPVKRLFEELGRRRVEEPASFRTETEEPPPPNPQLEEKRREIEERFNIKIMSSREFRQKYSDPFSRDETAMFISREDNRPENLSYEHLLFLEKGLSLLPNHFYKPDKEGRQLLIVLNPTLREQGICACGDLSRMPHKPHAIALGVLDVHPNQNFNIIFMDLVHELTHSFTVMHHPEGSELILLEPYKGKIEQLLKQLRIPTIWRSPLLLKINQKLSPLIELPDASLDRLKRYGIERLEDADFMVSQYPRQELSDQEREKFQFYNKLVYGLMGSSHEFIAVLSGHYIFGKSYFFENYGELFDQGIVERLYNFVKEEIFRGREY